MQIRLLVRALWELFRYDLLVAIFGFRAAYSGLKCLPCRKGTGRRTSADQVCNAMTSALTLYWKPVRCLQRSIALGRLLRLNGWGASVVIGYQPLPSLVTHGWNSTGSW